jgi:hypothetical protein
MLNTLSKPTNVVSETDTIGGGSYLLDSGIYDMTIDTAWVGKSKGGAMNVNMTLKSGNKTLRSVIYITSGDAKGNKTTYLDKAGAEHYLPGFSQVDSMCLLAIGKSITELETTKKVIKVFDPAVSKEVPTEVDMIMDLLGTTIKVGVLKQVVDKTAKNGRTGDYEPTGETREINEIDKFFRSRDGLTTAEIRAGEEIATFHATWQATYKGIVQNKAKGASGAANRPQAGMPPPAGKPAPAASSMFN